MRGARKENGTSKSRRKNLDYSNLQKQEVTMNENVMNLCKIIELGLVKDGTENS